LEKGFCLMLTLWSNLCPVCHKGRIFRGFFMMNPRCPHCGEVFEKESGYFVGAMIASYFLGVFLALPVLLLSIFRFELEAAWAITLCIGQTLLMQPFLFRYSRILWIQLEAQLTQVAKSGSNRKT
jgi:uncharacterized protein (DUF983 family)